MVTEEKKEYKLIYPIIMEDEKGGEIIVEKVVLERMKAKHLKLLPPSLLTEDGKGQMEAGAMLPVIAAMTHLTPEVLDEMDMEDLTPIMESIANFLGKDRSPKTGEK